MYNYRQFNFALMQDVKEEEHLHSELEIIYVLEGTVEVKIREKSYSLGKEDVIVVNSSMAHSVHGSKGSILCDIKYDYRLLVFIVKNPSSFFVCNSCTDKYNSCREIRALCQELVYQEVTDTHKTDSYKYGILYQILDELVEKHLANAKDADVSETAADH
jgi:hypothetical protein